MKLRPKRWRYANRLTPEAFATPAGRRRAWRELMLADHGVLRLVYDNTHPVACGLQDVTVWRSYQPSPGRLARFAKRGVRTIVNLRGETPSGQYYLERGACEKLGLALVDLRAYSRGAPSKAFLAEARALFAQIEYPAVFHCKSGADRAGLVSALYLLAHAGRPIDEARRHLSLRYGHVRWGKTGVLDAFFDAYEAANAAAPIGFWTWVETAYDPAAVEASFRATWWGSLLTERVLRRE